MLDQQKPRLGHFRKVAAHEVGVAVEPPQYVVWDIVVGLNINDIFRDQNCFVSDTSARKASNVLIR